ncbi:hypothetical protein [Pseudobacteriovorax antillogorgiicola]|uniref:C2H2-type domain-containing protein n=1 Tax=Pseudobacteriovorax antillogorgiicola TaxID=1513793 RepID=A0A1Y6BSS9_9BACT|nr:hypothetical protein [Pseudobacteriovorax antillogorgiicola]TCS52990.1 hypothetical protein EDD56_10841 [Pseudobacteriovorax antillogorgiicola]SMF27278.1 hypothetical protein SAMN06296036_108206 [Pseudobacteriovorax antillogorgiicola]
MNIDFKKITGKTQAGRVRFEFYCTDCSSKFWYNFHWFYHDKLHFLKYDAQEAKSFCEAINNQNLERLTDSKVLVDQIMDALCNCDPNIAEVIDPEKELRILYAKRLLDPSIAIPEKLSELVKHSQPKKVRELWEELEALGAEVRELVYEGRGVFGFKLYTDKGVYLDYGTKSEIIELIKNDNNLS